MLVSLNSVVVISAHSRVQQFNMTDMLNGNTFTILAPTNDAFSVLSEEEFNNLVHVIDFHQRYRLFFTDQK